MTGTIAGNEVVHDVDADWVLAGHDLASGVLGNAAPVGDTIPFVFGDGEPQVHNTFVYHRGADSWEWTIVNVRGDEGREFAHVTLQRRFDAVPGDWSPRQREILDAIAELSASTAPGGGGADDYATMLTEDFSRWTIGSDVLNGKENWVDGIRTWYDDGWRVSDRQAEALEITVEGETAFPRRRGGVRSRARISCSFRAFEFSDTTGSVQGSIKGES